MKKRLKLPKKITISDIFRKGDVICDAEAYKEGWIFFLIADDDDIEEYSGKGHQYIILLT